MALLGRQRELEELEAHVRDACAGSGRLVLLEGPAGIGKSGLLRELRTAVAAHGARWLGARGSEIERDVPFGVVRQLFEAAVRADSGTAMAGAAALSGTVLGAPDDQGGAAEPGFAVLHGLFWLVANLAEQGPLVLAVDDLQWADAPSLRFLDHLTTRLEGLPVLVACAARSGDATLTVGPIARLVAHADAHTLAVPPLDRPAVAALVAVELGASVPDDLVAACHEVTDGNPFLLREVAGELRRSGAGPAGDPAAVRRLAPPTIVRSLRLRLADLPAHATALARAVAVLGDGCDLAAAAELARLRPEAAQDAAEVLAAADLLARARPLRFSHPVVASAARETMLGAVRSDLHRRAAAMAAARPGGADAAAAHLLHVDPCGDARAAALLRDAAAVARRRGAPDTASTYLRRALAEPPAPADLPGILAELAGAAGFAGEPDALVFAERAVEVAGDPVVRLHAAREAALVHVTAGRHAAAADAMARVLSQDGLPERERLAGEGLLLVAAALGAEARRAHADRLRAARDIAERLGDSAPAALLVLTAFELVLVGGEPQRGGRLLERALAEGRLLEEVTADSPFPYIAGNALIVAGRYGLADELVTDVIADAAARGSIRAYALATAQRALARLREGRLRAAEADARAALEVGDGRTLVQLSVAASALAGTLTATGDHAAAMDALAQIPAAGRRPETHTGVVVEDVRARLHAAREHWEEALLACRSCAAWEREFGVRHGGWTAWRSLAAEGHAALGDRRRAAALAAEGLRLARAYGVPRTLGLSLLGAGTIAEDPAERVPLLAEAAEVLVRGGVQAEAARALLALGSALEDAGRREDARGAWARALSMAEPIGARPVEQAARDALVVAGARPRRRSSWGAPALTAGERRVAELAAGGATNREVAERLFLTLKTVENHLTSTYRKLGISSRAQLADRLGA